MGPPKEPHIALPPCPPALVTGVYGGATAERFAPCHPLGKSWGWQRQKSNHIFWILPSPFPTDRLRAVVPSRSSHPCGGAGAAITTSCCAEPSPKVKRNSALFQLAR